MRYVRAIVKVLFCAGAFLLLLFAVCVLGLSAYSLFQVATSGRSPLSGADMYTAPLLGLTVLTASLYILAGQHQWHFYAAVTLIGSMVSGAILLLIAGAAGIRTPWPGDEVNMGMGIGAYGLFLLAGILLKHRGVWHHTKLET